MVVVGLASCFGCQLQITNAEAHLLDVLGQIDLRYWQLASSDPMPEDFDVAIIEGAVTTEESERRCAACARRRARSSPWARAPRRPAFRHGRRGVPRASWAGVRSGAVGLRRHGGAARGGRRHRRGLRGACAPIDSYDFIDVLQRALYGSNKTYPSRTMCGDCKRNETSCFFGKGQLCLGLVTTAGCGAKCVNLGRPCNGCRGLSPDANLASAREAVARYGVSVADFDQALEMFNQTNPCPCGQRVRTHSMTKTAIHVDHIARVRPRQRARGHRGRSENRRDERRRAGPPVREHGARPPLREIPYISSRICGICSSSHVVTDLKAIERVFGVEVTDRTRALRELLVYGSILQNHASHLFVFAAPDFLGMPSVFPLAQTDPELFEQALGLKALGNELCTKVGGRSIHPTAVVGASRTR